MPPKKRKANSSDDKDSNKRFRFESAGAGAGAGAGVGVTTIPKPFFGESICTSHKSDGTACDKKAYYTPCVCGRHKKDSSVKLKKNPDAAKNAEAEYKLHMETVMKAEALNKSEGKRGTVTCVKLGMFQTPPLQTGVEDIRPNHKDKAVKNARGLPSLSPKSMGPISDRVKTLENFHQGNKVFPETCKDGGNAEIDEKVRDIEDRLSSMCETPSTVNEAFTAIGALLSQQSPPTKEFEPMQKAMHADPIPWRHQRKFIEAHPELNIKFDEKDGRKNIPLYAIHNGKRYCYVDSRQFYCHYYETFAAKDPHFIQLKFDVDNGRNVRVVGYDGYQPMAPLNWHYLDQSKPFGHELVLYTMLTVSDPKEYPWNVFATG